MLHIARGKLLSHPFAACAIQCYKKFRAFPKGHSISVGFGFRPSSVKAESFQPVILRLVIGIIYDHTRSY